MFLKIISFMIENSSSINSENEEFNLINSNDYKNLISRLKEISKTIALLEKIIFK